MFTGLVESTGTVLSREGARLTISAPGLAARLKTGDSVAVSGVCLTALDITLTRFSADLARETLERTTLARLSPGAVVNLELPTPAGAPLGGHVVQGHVDGVGTLISLEPINPADEESTDWRLRLHVPSNLSKYVVAQGSITVEGISLTVADVLGDVVSVAVIPHTYRATALHALLPGAALNVEVDVLGKYAEKQREAGEHSGNAVPAPPTPSGWSLTENYLLSNGY